MKKVIIGTLLAVSLVGLFLLLPSSNTDSTQNKNADSDTNITSQQRQNPVVRTKEQAPDLIIGSASAQIDIIEFADFKCPTCNKFTRTVYNDLKREYIDKGTVKIIFRNLPFIAPDSRTAAEGAYCANEQGAFGLYHDILYGHIWDEYYSKGKISEGESTQVFSEDNLRNLVGGIEGFNKEKFSTCLTNKDYSQAVDSDLALSHSEGANGTPTFIIGGQKIVGAQPFGIFDKLIQAQSR